jgi:hypothetical protein
MHAQAHPRVGTPPLNPSNQVAGNVHAFVGHPKYEFTGSQCEYLALSEFVLHLEFSGNLYIKPPDYPNPVGHGQADLFGFIRLFVLREAEPQSEINGGFTDLSIFNRRLQQEGQIGCALP